MEALNALTNEDLIRLVLQLQSLLQEQADALKTAQQKIVVLEAVSVR